MGRHGYHNWSQAIETVIMSWEIYISLRCFGTEVFTFIRRAYFFENHLLF